MNKQNRLIDTENRLTVVRGEGFGKLGGKGEGLSSTNGELQNSPRDVDCSRGNTVNDMVMNMCGARWVPEAARGPPCEARDFLATLLDIWN